MKSKKFVAVILTSFVAIAVSLSSCAFGVLPSWNKDSNATVLLSFGGLDLASSSSGRAVVQGGGYLYLRTIGGPSGNAGPFYGPYSVSAGTPFSSTDLPAGTYKSIFILYSAVALDEAKTFSFNGTTYTFRQLMQLSDDGFYSMVENDDALGLAIDKYFDGQVSGQLIENVTLKAGETTSLSATLLPLTGLDHYIDLSSRSSFALPPTTVMVRKFYELDKVSAGSGSELAVTLTPAAGTTANIGIVALYDGAGRKLASSAAAGTVSAAQKYKATANGDSTMFLYVEYQASSLVMSFEGVSAGFMLNLDGNATFANKKFYYGLYDVTNVPAGTMSSGPAGDLVGVAVVNLDSSGSGSAQAISLETKAPAAISAGSTYAVWGFIDMNGYYSALASSSVITQDLMDRMKPNFGDYSPESVVVKPVSATMNYTLNSSALSKETSYAYFVSATGNGTGNNGLDPCSFNSAMSKSADDGSASSIYLLEDVSTTSETYSIGEAVYITSAGSTRRTIALGTQSDIFLNVLPNGSLTLQNVRLDGTSSSFISSVIQVGTSASLYLINGAVISNISITDEAAWGIVNVDGMMYMQDAGIENGNSMGPCAGVLVDENGSLSMVRSSWISGCTAYNNGGGICVQGGSATISGSSSIINCTATPGNSGCGGGIFMSSGSVYLQDSCKISGCKANNGGGMFIANGCSLSIAGTVTITDNDATVDGGGIYNDNSPITGSTDGVTGNTSGTAGRENVYTAM
jgi:hypothetical protein